MGDQEHLAARRGVNAGRQAEEEAAAGRIEANGQVARELVLAQARADGTRAMGEAAAAEAARVAAYRDLTDAVMPGLAVKELAANQGKIDSLVVT